MPGRTDAKSKTVKTTERLKNSTAVFPTFCDTCFFLPPPTACPMLTVVPIARPTIITVSICITCEPTDTAVVLATPSNCPTMNKSAIPYSVCKKYASKYGRENIIRFLKTLPLVRFFSIKHTLLYRQRGLISHCRFYAYIINSTTIVVSGVFLNFAIILHFSSYIRSRNTVRRRQACICGQSPPLRRHRSLYSQDGTEQESSRTAPIPS